MFRQTSHCTLEGVAVRIYRAGNRHDLRFSRANVEGFYLLKSAMFVQLNAFYYRASHQAEARCLRGLAAVVQFLLTDYYVCTYK